MQRSITVALLAYLVSACSTTPAVTPSAITSTTPTEQPIVAPTPSPTAAPTVDPLVAALHEAAAETIAARTVSLEQSVEFKGSSVVPDGTSVTGAGGTSFGEPRQMSIRGDYGDLGLGNLRFILDEDLLYLRGDVIDRVAGRGNWLLVDLASDDPRAVPFLGVTSGQNDASLVMYFLYGATSPVTVATGGTINGVSTTHYTLDLDLELAAERAPAAGREPLLDNIAALRSGGVDRTLGADIWVGTDGLVHRVDNEYTAGRVAGGGTIDVSYTFSDFGVPLVLGIPDEADIVRLEDTGS